MKYTKNSELLIISSLKNSCVTNEKFTNKTRNIFTQIYNEIINADKYLFNLKKTYKSLLYNPIIKKIENVYHIIKPTTFSSHGFPKPIINYINENMVYEVSYTFSLLNRKINIYFLLEEGIFFFKEVKYKYMVKLGAQFLEA